MKDGRRYTVGRNGRGLKEGGRSGKREGEIKGGKEGLKEGDRGREVWKEGAGLQLIFSPCNDVCPTRAPFWSHKRKIWSDINTKVHSKE